MVDPAVDSIRIGRNGLQIFKVKAGRCCGVRHVRQRIKVIQQRQRGLIQHGGRNGIIGKRLTSRGIDQNRARLAGRWVREGRWIARGHESTEITVPFRLRRNQELLGLRGSPAVPFIIKEEEGFVVSVVELGNQHRTA